MPKPSQVILLVEDDRHQQFISRYLRKVGLGTHAIRIRKAPSGAGSAEQWVREQFAVEVEACRRRHPKTQLIVIVDADTRTIEQRMRQLDQALQQAGVQPIDNTQEEIARLLPKRNIETWILCLNDESVTEQTDYKQTRGDWTDLIKAAINPLYAWTRPHATVPAACVGSLRAGILELQRLRL